MTNLMLHCGTNVATFEEVAEIPTPEPTASWHPIPHRTLIETVMSQLTALGLHARNAEYGLWGDDGARMFAAFELVNGKNAEDYSLVIGLRNSHDKMFSAGLAVGSRVFVCDNLSFSGEITIARKHTRYIERDLPRLSAQAVGRIGQLRIRQDERIVAYKQTEIDDRTAHDLLVRAIDTRVIPVTRLPKVLEEWREPQHEEFQPRNAWSLFNAFTERLKGTNVLELPRRTTRLCGLMDQVSGLALEPIVVGDGMDDVEVRDVTAPSMN